MTDELRTDGPVGGARAGPSSGSVVAVDVGGSSIKAGIFDAAGSVQVTRVATGRERGPVAVIETVLDVVGAQIESLRRDTGSMPRAIGIAVPGHVDEHRGVALFSENIGWRDVPFRALLAERFQLPVTVVHDVRAGGVAEAQRGAGVGADPMLFVAIGTGISAALVVGGRVLRGRSGLAGEIGHIRVQTWDGPCGCGGFGCLESVFSAGALERRYALDTGTRASAADVAGLVAEGDGIAVRLWRTGVSALAEVLAGVILVLDPERIVIGGGVATAGALLFDPLQGELVERLPFVGPPPVVPAALGADAGFIGAGLAAWDLLP